MNQAKEETSFFPLCRRHAHAVMLLLCIFMSACSHCKHNDITSLLCRYVYVVILLGLVYTSDITT